MKQIRKRLTYANVMSSLAVFLVLGGGAAVAATNLGKNSVGTGQLKRNSVKVGKLAPEAVRAGKLAKNAVTTNRLRDNAVATNTIGNLQVTTAKLDKEAVISEKIAKDAVVTDKIATDAVTGEKVKESTLGPVPDASKLGGRAAAEYLRSPIRRVEAISANTSAVGQFRNVTASCPAGERAISGGGMWTQLSGGPTGFNILQGSRPVPSTDGTGITTGWQATGTTSNAAPRQLRAYVLCIPQ